VLIKVVLVLEHLGAVLADLVGGRGVTQDHVPLHVALLLRHFTTQCALESSVDRSEELHDVHFIWTRIICNVIGCVFIAEEL